MDSLPDEVYANIIPYVPPNGLLSLSRTCKALQPPAEAKIYESLIMRDASILFLACRAILAADIRGIYVRRLWFYPDLRRLPRSLGVLPTHFWQAVQTAMTKMTNLEDLALHDPTSDNTWVLASPHFSFQLREANLHLPWDANMVKFLQTQDRLRSLVTMDSFDDGPPCAVAPDKLQALEVYSGPILVLRELLVCPLTHVQITVDEDTAALIPTLLTDMGKVKKSLRSISVLHLPEHSVLETLQLISTSVFSPTLRHLGIIPLPVLDRHEIHRCLMQLPSLRALQVDLSRWMPPAIEPSQKMIATELQTYCPSLTCISFWMGQHLFTWYYREDKWLSSPFTGRYQTNEALWRNT